MFSDYDLKKYAQRQQEANKNKMDMLLNNALEEQKLKQKGTMEAQESANKTVLAQEEMQQAGGTLRQKMVNDAAAPYSAALTKKVSAETATTNLSNEFQKAVQPKLIEETKATADASMAKSGNFLTYHSQDKAKLERQALVSGYNVAANGAVTNNPEYYKTGGIEALKHDMQNLTAGDFPTGAYDSKERVKPLGDRPLGDLQAETLSSGNKIAPRAPGESMSDYLARARKVSPYATFGKTGVHTIS